MYYRVKRREGARDEASVFEPLGKGKGSADREVRWKLIPHCVDLFLRR